MRALPPRQSRRAIPLTVKPYAKARAEQNQQHNFRPLPEIEFEQRFIKEHPEFKAESNLAAMVGVMDKLKTQPIVIGSDWDHGTPTIYTASELIDRAEAERMLAAMMRHLGFESVRFKWKRPRILIRPVG